MASYSDAIIFCGTLTFRNSIGMGTSEPVIEDCILIFPKFV